jgi:sugar phosphate isomerase/epimerase
MEGGKETVANRLLGTMIIYGFATRSLSSELDLAQQLGVDVLEILPDWKEMPDPSVLHAAVADRGLAIHSAHGCWGGRSIKADRVDLGDTDPQRHRQSVDDLKRCVDWLEAAGGRCLVVHPGGLSHPTETEARRACLACGLLELAAHAQGSRVVVCVENMPPGVHPGSRMGDLTDLVRELDRPCLALALDTGHAHLSADVRTETLAAGDLLATTHVHDNDGRRDSHDSPGLGTIDWVDWASALDQVGYRGPIMMECIRQLREDPSLFRPDLLATLTGQKRGDAGCRG